MRFSTFAFDVVTDPAELEAARQERARRPAAAPNLAPSLGTDAKPAPTATGAVAPSSGAT